MKLKEIVLTLGGLVFLVFAYLQFNDTNQYGNEDAWAWIVIYVLAALLSFSCAFGDIAAPVLYVWTGFILGALVFRLQDDQGNFHLDRLDPSTYWNEEKTQMIQSSNESGGLVILLVWAIVMLILSRPKRSQHYIS